MSRWSDQLKNHPIHETIRQLQEWVSTEFEDVSEEEFSERNRFNKVLGLYKSKLESIDAEIAPFNQIDGLNSQLKVAQIWNQANAYAQNRNITHLKAANDHLSGQLTQLSLLLPLVEGDNQKLVHDDSSSLEYALRVLIKKKEELESDLSKIGANIDMSNAEVAELNLAIDERKKESDAALSQWQQQFSDAQEKRSNNFNEWKNAIDGEIKGKTSSITSKTQEAVETYRKGIEEALNQLNDDAKAKHNAILELYELASGDSISGGYAQTANKERFQTNFWRAVSFAFIIAAVFWLYSAYQQVEMKPTSGYTFIKKTDPETTETVDGKTKNIARIKKDESKNNDGQLEIESKIQEPNNQVNTASFWQHLLLSFSLTGVLLFGAGYAARQAHSHRTTEQKTRWFALQIKALDPYISSMEPGDQLDLKKQLADKFFNGVEQSSVDDIKVFDSDTPSSLINSVTNLVKQTK